MRASIRLPLAILFAFILIQGQAMALGPGVPYGGRTSIQGTFTGVFLPGAASTDFDPTVPINEDALIGTNSLGLFVLGAESGGRITGTAIFFMEGVAFNATLQGLSDARKAQLFAVMDLISARQIPNPFTINRDANLIGSGRMVARVTRASGRGGFAGARQNLIGTASVTANIDFDLSFVGGDPDATLFRRVRQDFLVDGVQQSTGSTAPRLEFGGAARSG